MDTNLVMRVRQILDRLSLSQRALASAIDLDETKLAKSLSGKRRFTSLELALIADLGRTSVEWILTGTEPRTIRFARRVLGADRSVGDGVGAELVGMIADRADSAAELGFLPEIPSLPEVPADWSYVSQANTLAAVALGRLEMPIRGLETAELIQAIEHAFGIHVVVHDLPDTVDGLSYSSGDLRVIVLATTDRSARQRFTLGHELAHILFSDSPAGLLEETMFAPADQSEKRANVFAAAFLTPEEEVLGALGSASVADAFDSLVWEFAVSPEAMAWRLQNLGKVTEGERAQLARRTAAISAKNVERLAGHELRITAAQTPQAPGRLSAAYLQAYIDGDIAAGPVAQITGWTPDEVRDAAGVSDSDIDWLDAFGER